MFSLHSSANHRGWFEFRICPNNNIHAPVTHTCLDQFLLTSPDGGTTRFPVEALHTGDVMLLLRLPLGLTCAQCVLQWEYNTGNSWGVDPLTGRGCLGCGRQEQFYACADVAITSGGFGHVQHSLYLPPSNYVNPYTAYSPINTQESVLSYYQRPETAVQVVAVNRCRSAGAWLGRADMTSWCQQNCASGFCPESHCVCS